MNKNYLGTNIFSPLTFGATKKVAEFKVIHIIDEYRNLYGIDVSSIFKGVENLFLYYCNDSGYEFYYPFDLEGGDAFYKQLAEFDWYYIPWKWEHEQSLTYVAKSKSILEVGCGSGFYLKNLQQRFPEKQICGLEITVNNAPEQFIINDTIQGYAESSDKKYDIVCSYQVLEHIADVSSFLEASLKALNQSGYLIVSVPNNNSILLKKNREAFLNMPPHHMGLWNQQSLEYLTRLFPIQLERKYYEPIQDYHFEWFKSILKQKIRRTKFPLSFRITNNKRIMNGIAKILRKFYRGHSIMFVYKKL